VARGIASLDGAIKGVGVESIRAHKHAIMRAYFQKEGK